MSIKLGLEKVSAEQISYLNTAIAETSTGKKALYLARVFSDDDIQSGKETLHPQWMEIYKSTRLDLPDYLKGDVIEKIQETFGDSLFDAEISTIDPQSINLAFLLGAGASKPKPSDIPTVKELLPDLLTRARKLDRIDLQKLADFCERSRINNIEDLLTAAQLSEFCSRNPSVLGLVDFLIYRQNLDPYEKEFRGHKGSMGDLSAIAFLQDTLQVLFGLLSSRMLPAQPNSGHIAIAKYAHGKPNSAIVTTNYDCCMDLALRSQEANFSYLVDFANKKLSSISTSEPTPLIKLHGSLNWYYCETCQQVHLIDIEKTVKEYLADENCYSVIAVCKDCGGQRRGLLVPPLAMKFDMAPPLTPLIEKAQDCFNKANVIVVVGFSFAEADMYISRMLTKSMQIDNKTKIILFDPDYNVVKKLRRQLSLRISNFDEKRVIYIQGDCSITLPMFLEGKLKAGTSEDSNSDAKHTVTAAKEASSVDIATSS